MRIRKSAIVFSVALSLGCVATASPADTVTGDKGSDMVVDLVVLRPLGLVSTAVGSAVFVLALPFTLPSGTARESACELVKRPAAYTFTRPLGDLDDWSAAGRPDCTKPKSQ